MVSFSKKSFCPTFTTFFSCKCLEIEGTVFGPTSPRMQKSNFWKLFLAFKWMEPALEKGTRMKRKISASKRDVKQNFWRDRIYELGPWMAQAVRQSCGWNFVWLLGPISGLVHRFCPSSNFAWHLSFKVSFPCFALTIHKCQSDIWQVLPRRNIFFAVGCVFADFSITVIF